MSGNDEITFDEIGEINTHIQNEAGGDVDIIMGVEKIRILMKTLALLLLPRVHLEQILILFLKVQKLLSMS